MYTKNTSKRLTLALLVLTLLGACKQPKNAATLRKHGNQKIIAGSVVGAAGVASALASIGTFCTAGALALGPSTAATGLAITSMVLAPIALVTVPVGIALVVIGATEHRKAKKLAEQERLAALEETQEPASWHNQPLELEPVS